MKDIILSILILYGMFCTVVFTLLLIYEFKYKEQKSRNLEQYIEVLKYLNNDIGEIEQIIERLEKEIKLNLVKNKRQLRQRFSELVVSYGYVPKLNLKITE